MIAHVIHDPDRCDRSVSLERECKEQGITPQFWNPVYDKSPSIGIRKAHQQIIEFAKMSYKPEVLILEDDVRFCGPNAFRYFLENKPNDFDLWLGGIYSGYIDSHGIAQNFSGLHCYIIHERFYDTVLNYNSPYHLDKGLSKIGGKFVVCNPFAAIQYNGYSDNVKREVNYDEFLKDKKFYNGWNPS